MTNRDSIERHFKATTTLTIMMRCGHNRLVCPQRARCVTSTPRLQSVQVYVSNLALRVCATNSAFSISIAFFYMYASVRPVIVTALPLITGLVMRAGSERVPTKQRQHARQTAGPTDVAYPPSDTNTRQTRHSRPRTRSDLSPTLATPAIKRREIDLPPPSVGRNEAWRMPLGRGAGESLMWDRSSSSSHASTED